jgi:hypothetical protein
VADTKRLLGKLWRVRSMTDEERASWAASGASC